MLFRSEKQQLEQKTQQLQSQLQAKRDAQSAIARAASLSSTVYAAAGCGDNQYASYIYMHESGCNTASTNSIGCFGIGQDCNGVVRSQCGTDYSCQNSYFSAYAIRRYGSWQAAYNFWLSNHWW